MSVRPLIVLVVLCLAGCGVVGRDRGPALPDRDREAVRGDEWTSCAEERDRAEKRADAMRLPLIGRDTTAVAVVVCAEESRQISGGGSETVETEQRADDLAALLTALRRPDERRPPDIGCGANVVAVPWLALVDRNGRWLRTGVPQDVCGQPHHEVVVAIRELRVTLVRSRVLDGGEEQACSLSHPDPVWVMGEPTPLVPDVDQLDLELPPVLMRCGYRVDPADRRIGPPIGAAERDGGRLDDGQQVTTLLGTHGPAPACAAAVARFVRLYSPARPSRDLYVELDGCTRILAMVLPGPPGPLIAPRLVVVGSASEQLRSYLDRA